MSIVVATPERSVTDEHARVFLEKGILASYCSGTRRGTAGVPRELTHLAPVFGFYTMATRRAFSVSRGEWFRAWQHPLFGAWVARHLKPGQHLLSSYGYANRALKKAQAHGGLAFVDACNSHPIHLWDIVAEEHQRWNCDKPPYTRHWNLQARESVEIADYFFCPSHFVRNSFLQRGYAPERLLHLPYNVDLSVFKARMEVTVPAEPLRVVCTGAVSLRKGFPYLLEAVRLIRKEREVVAVLTDHIDDSMKEVLPKFSDVPIEWAPSMSRDKLSAHLGGCHVFALLSVEEGMARTALEAMASGVPVVVTPNTGVDEMVTPGVNGEVVPIRDAQAAAAAIVACHERQLQHGPPQVADLHERISYPRFFNRLTRHLETLGLA